MTNNYKNQHHLVVVGTVFISAPIGMDLDRFRLIGLMTDNGSDADQYGDSDYIEEEFGELVHSEVERALMATLSIAIIAGSVLGND